jgi:DNA-binding NarL/FixJ family response regulator
MPSEGSPRGDDAPMIRLLVVDDHALVRAGLVHLLTSVPDFSVVGEASDGAAALEAVVADDPGVRPDVVLMDLSMPGMDGIAATRAIVAASPTTRVLALTSFDDQARVLAMLDAGAAGYLVKDAKPQEILDAVRAAHRGDAPLSLAASTALVRARASRSTQITLTSREQDVLARLSEGLSNQSIARDLSISEATVKAHLTQIYQALSVSDRTSAVVKAIQIGLVPPPR